MPEILIWFWQTPCQKQWDQIGLFLKGHGNLSKMSILIKLLLLIFGCQFEVFFKKIDHSRPLFLYVSLFNIVYNTVDSKQNLPTTGFEPRIGSLEARKGRRRGHGSQNILRPGAAVIQLLVLLPLLLLLQPSSCMQSLSSLTSPMRCSTTHWCRC